MPDAYLFAEVTLMKSKILTAICATSLLLGMFALQGCYETNYPDYGNGGYGYGSGPAYYSTPVIVEHRTWHDRWWGNSHDRDDDHHEGWRAERHEHEAHAARDRDHDHDRD